LILPAIDRPRFLRTIEPMTRILHYTAIVLLAGMPIFAQSSESIGASRKFTFYEKFQGSASTLGVVNELDSSVGYNFNSHFSADVGLPVYFVRPSSSATAGTGAYSANGIGNAYAQLRLALPNPTVNFTSILTGTAPTGAKADGFSTGHATVDWSNYFDHSFSSLTPFVNLGFANSASDTMFFVRPYTTYGLVTHVEGGARYRLVRGFSVGGSLYGIEPSGQQTVVSRIVHGQAQSGTATAASGTPGRGTLPATSSRKNHGVFETASVTTGSANISQDHGVSAWGQPVGAPNVLIVLIDDIGLRRAEQVWHSCAYANRRRARQRRLVGHDFLTDYSSPRIRSPARRWMFLDLSSARSCRSSSSAFSIWHQSSARRTSKPNPKLIGYVL